MERKRSVKRYGSRRYKKSFGAKCKDFWRNFIAFMFSNVGIIGLVVGYTIAGAVMFQAIEGHSSGSSNTPSLAQARNETILALWELFESGNVSTVAADVEKWRRYATPTLRAYTSTVVDAVRDGFDGADTQEDLEQKWAFPSAFLYSLTVITTIGYGNVSPKKPWGKIMTIVYAIAGMPLFLLYLSNIGDILARCFKWLYAKCCLCRWCPNVAKKREERRRRRLGELDEDTESVSTQRRHTGVSLQMEDLDMEIHHGEEVEEEEGSDTATNAMYDEEYDPQTVTVPVTICLTIMVGYVCGGALLFAEYEGWDYLDGSYFCFISLSTIGFGDFVPGVNTYFARQGQAFAMSFVFCAMYLMLGMALIAMCFNLMQEEVIHKIRTMVRTVKRICR